MNFRCFTCSGVGHHRKDCPLKNHSAPVEARGQQAPHNTTAGKFTAALQKTSEANSVTGKAEKRIEQLRSELQKAELEASLVTATATTTTNVLSSDPNPFASCEGTVWKAIVDKIQTFVYIV